jgi:hypothetical protein
MAENHTFVIYFSFCRFLRFWPHTLMSMVFCARVADNYIHEFIPNNDRPADSSNGEEILGHDGGIPIFRMRSAEETEVAHDLLELSRSLPPLPPPGQVSAVPLSSMHEHQVESSDEHQQHLEVSLFSHYSK